MTLRQFFAENPHTALALSGGVDSTYLLYAAAQCCADVQPYYVSTQFQPAFELADAEAVCEKLGFRLKVLSFDVLRDPTVRSNPADRCYYCKTVIFTQIRKAVEEDGYPLVIDGTNASDDAGDRPGMRALRELGVRSPLRECGLTKADIRRLSREAELFTADKPAYACLATRIQTSMPLTAELLTNVEQAEQELFRMGFSDFRVRIRKEGPLLQFPEDQLPQARENWPEILQAMRQIFGKDEIRLDPKGR